MMAEGRTPEAVEVDEEGTAGTTSDGDNGNGGGGSAYCFLPLPVSTGLPIHVNGYFQLSSNRRDIWWSADDMAGDGRRRAVWNASLIADVAGPCYCRALAGAIKAWEEEEESSSKAEEMYEALFPTGTANLAGLWKLLSHRLCADAKNLPVLRCRGCRQESILVL